MMKETKQGGSGVFHWFSACILLAMSRIHRFEELVFDFMRSLVLSVYRDHERLINAPWLKSKKDSVWV